MIKKKTLCLADLCAEVHNALAGSSDDTRWSKEAIAIASYVKNHRVNPRNVAEVIQIMWPEASVRFRFDEMLYETMAVSFDIQFPDGSSGMMVSNNGIFDEFQTFGWPMTDESPATKKERVEELVRIHPGLSRPELVQLVIEEVGMTPAGASTYVSNALNALKAELIERIRVNEE